MKHTREELIEYRLQRAKESFEEAKLLAQSNHWNTVANRLYYAAFYAINALFVKHEIQGATHNGIKANFHKEFIKTGLIDIDSGKLYNNLFNKRQEGDYQDFQIFVKEDIEPLIDKVQAFVFTIENMI
jgi:uncharacterized protein